MKYRKYKFHLSVVTAYKIIIDEFFQVKNKADG